jgi:diguanylate cyclase (GGDEF)-like protein
VTLQLLPSQFYFSSATEHDFQYLLNKNTLHIANVTLYLVTVFLLSFIFISWFDDKKESTSTINILRIIMVGLSVYLIYINKKLKPEKLHTRYFLYGILFCLLFGYFFWTYVKTYYELHEGGPMLVAAAFVAIPMLHLGHKLVLWSIIAIGLLVIELYSSISIIWTLYFYFSMVIVMAIIQYQLDILLRKQYQAELLEAEKANIDQLTGMSNRHSFDKHCKTLIKKLKPSQYLALAMIDVDYFKKYNDNYGHLEGDNVLVEVANRLKDCGADITVRFGGEEFILVKTVDENQLHWLSDLTQRFANEPIAHAYSPFNYVTVSAGVAYDKYCQHRPSIETLLATADTAMYKSKAAGRNRLTVKVIES